MKYSDLVRNVEHTHSVFFNHTVNAVNQTLTIRNWIIGYYIVVYEQKGNDRAKYGKKLLQSLAEKLNQRGLSYRNLNLFRKFYLVYPEIMQLLTAQSDLSQFPIMQLATAELKIEEQLSQPRTNTISQLSIDQLKKENKTHLSVLITKTSFTHFVELISIEDTIQRKFYELLIINTTPSVKELKRQINTLAFQRVGLSENTEIAFSQLKAKITPTLPGDIIKSHYFLEFLNFNKPELIEENELEQALISHLQNFILELGNGFCFEARQKRILIGEKYYFVDLVFYHRLLKCHVLIELKVNDFEHSNASQLNTYINYFIKEIQQGSDNPPIGILMVANKDQSLVEYATAGMDQNLFVSKYMLQLPKKKQLENFLNNELKKL